MRWKDKEWRQCTEFPARNFPIAHRSLRYLLKEHKLREWHDFRHASLRESIHVIKTFQMMAMTTLRSGQEAWADSRAQGFEWQRLESMYKWVSRVEGGGSRKRAFFREDDWSFVYWRYTRLRRFFFFAYCCCNNTIFSVPTWMPSFFRYPSLLLRFYVLIRFRLLLPGFYWFIQFCISFHGQEWVRLSLPLELNFVCKNISGRERKKSRANQIFLLGIRLHLCEA